MGAQLARGMGAVGSPGWVCRGQGCVGPRLWGTEGDGMGYRPYGRVGLGDNKPRRMGDGFLLRCPAGREFPTFCLRAILLSV